MDTSAAGSRVSWPPGNVTQPPGLEADWKAGSRQWRLTAIPPGVGVALGTETDGLGRAPLGLGNVECGNGLQPVTIRRQTPMPTRSLVPAFTTRITMRGPRGFRPRPGKFCAPTTNRQRPSPVTDWTPPPFQRLNFPG